MINKHYLNRYNKLINFRKNNPLPNDQYGEMHHITPKCIGGTNDQNNLVMLSGREHYIAHYLLAKAYPKKKGLWYAFNMMKRISNGKSVLYEAARKHISKNISNDKIRAEKISSSLKGRVFSDEHKAKISKARKKYVGWKHTDITKRKMSENGIKGRKMCHNPNTQDIRFIEANESVPEGYILGGNDVHKNVGKSFTERCWYHDPITKKNIRPHKNDKPPEGYVKGRYVQKIECCGKLWDPGNLKQHRKRVHGEE